MGILRGNPHPEFSARAGPRADLERPAEPSNALAHALEPDPPPPVVGGLRGWIEAMAVVGNSTADLARRPFQFDGGARGVGMPRHVREGLLHDTVDRGLNRRGQPAVRGAP